MTNDAERLVRLVIPDADLEPMKSRMRHPRVHGEHLAYNGRSGVLLGMAGAGGAWVRFDGQGRNEYVGVPCAWLEPVDVG